MRVEKLLSLPCHRSAARRAVLLQSRFQIGWMHAARGRIYGIERHYAFVIRPEVIQLAIQASGSPSILPFDSSVTVDWRGRCSCAAATGWNILVSLMIGTLYMVTIQALSCTVSTPL